MRKYPYSATSTSSQAGRGCSPNAGVDPKRYRRDSVTRLIAHPALRAYKGVNLSNYVGRNTGVVRVSCRRRRYRSLSTRRPCSYEAALGLRRDVGASGPRGRGRAVLDGRADRYIDGDNLNSARFGYRITDCPSEWGDYRDFYTLRIGDARLYRKRRPIRYARRPAVNGVFR